jgi:hypothetical protein
MMSNVGSIFCVIVSGIIIILTVGGIGWGIYRGQKDERP